MGTGKRIGDTRPWCLGTRDRLRWRWGHEPGRQRRLELRVGIKKEKEAVGQRIIFISLAQRRTGTGDDGGVGREKGATNERQGRWREEWLTLALSPARSRWRAPVGGLPCPFRACVPPVDLGGCPGSTTRRAQQQTATTTPTGPGSARRLPQRDTHACQGMCWSCLPCPC